MKHIDRDPQGRRAQRNMLRWRMYKDSRGRTWNPGKSLSKRQFLRMGKDKT